MTRLPSALGGQTTTQAGFFACESGPLAGWIRDGMGAGWGIASPGWSRDQTLAALTPSPELTRQAVLPLSSGWSAVLTNGPLGTDVGLMPSLAARELDCVAIRAVSADGPEQYPARIVEVFGPGGVAPLLSVRSVACVKDGGRWVFETSGTPFAFERLEQYRTRRKADRFTAELLGEFLDNLGVPETEPRWSDATLVTKN